MYTRDKTTIHDRREQLRVKVKSLAEEARIIRREEHRSWGELRAELHKHRVTLLRDEARHTHIAYGLIKGRGIDQMENPENWKLASQGYALAKEPDWDRVKRLIRRYGPSDFKFPAYMEKRPTPSKLPFPTTLSPEAAWPFPTTTKEAVPAK